jgi:hypothetical protein
VRPARLPALAAFLALALAARAAEKTPPPSGPVPIPYPNTSTTTSAASRDAASGLPTGKRMHKPYVFSKELDVKMPLADGRTFVVNKQTGQVVFGDGVQGRRPETGDVPADGKYRLGGGASGNVEVRGGKLLTVPTAVPTPAKTQAK